MRAQTDAAAAKAGMDRRAFRRPAGGVAAALAVYNLAACTSKGSSAANSTTTTTSTTAPGGSFSIPPAADVPACQQAFSSQGEFIFDVHTLHLMPDPPWVQN